jgi:hypothetical protein
VRIALTAAVLMTVVGLLSACANGKEIPPGDAALTGIWGTPAVIADTGERRTYVSTGGGRFRAFDGVTYPRVAVGAPGRAILLWHAREGPGYRPYASRIEPGRGWGPPEPVTDPRDGYSLANVFASHAVALAPDGEAVAVWGRAGCVESSRSSPGQSWTAPQAIAEGGAPRIGSDAAGRVVTLFFGPYDYSQRWSPIRWTQHTASWSAPETVYLGPVESGPFTNSPDLAVAPSGASLAVWIHGSNREVWVAPLAPGAEPAAISRVDRGSVLEIAVAAGNGGAVVAYRWEDAIWVQHSTGPNGGAGWSAPQRLSDPAPPGFVRRVEAMSLAADPAGNAVVVWTEGEYPLAVISHSYAVRSRRFLRSKGSWERILTIVGASGYPSSGVKVAVSAAGNALAVWRHAELVSGVGYTYTMSASHLAGGRWGPVERLRTRTTELSPPEVAMDREGNAVVAWAETEGIRARVVAVGFRATRR